MKTGLVFASFLAGIYLFVDLSEAGGYCDGHYCPGFNDYCCLDNDSNNICCSETDVSDLWWFWFVLAMVLVVCLSCISCCIRMRRNRASRRYLIITGERPVVACTTTTYPAYGACTGYGPEGCAPVFVSPGSYNQKLPPYSPVADNKGQPPSYNPPH